MVNVHNLLPNTMPKSTSSFGNIKYIEGLVVLQKHSVLESWAAYLDSSPQLCTVHEEFSLQMNSDITRLFSNFVHD